MIIALKAVWLILAYLVLLPELGTVYMFIHKQILKVFPKYDVDIRRIFAALLVALTLAIYFRPPNVPDTTTIVPAPTNIIVNKDGKKVAEQAPAVVDQKTIDRIADSVFNIAKKKYKTSVLISSDNGVTVKNSQGSFIDSNKPKPIDSAKLKEPGLAEIVFDMYKEGKLVPIDSVVLPNRVSVDSSKNMYRRETVTLVGVRLDSMSLPNKQSIRLTEEGGFFKKKKTVVQIINSNDYFSTANVESLIVPSRPTWWQKAGKPIAAAIITAIILRR